MKQLLQYFDTGEMALVDTPVPMPSAVGIVVEAHASLISAGTERSAVEMSRASLLQKAMKRPDQVKKVIQKMRTEGVANTMNTVRSIMREPIVLGYCNAGVVADVGRNVKRFAVGDRVVTNGPHAEYVHVPHTLAAIIPDNISFEVAAFTPLAAIALQGIRIANPTLGETVVVYGLGLVGLLSVQLLRANGCRVIGIDVSAERLDLARRFGAICINGAEEDVVARVLAETKEIGADAVLLTLAASSDEPVHHAALMSRKRGRIVLVGVTGLSLKRDDFYIKELSFSVSCSYGPGRYDSNYEDSGNDYPVGFVRWTEQRNFEAVLDLMREGLLDCETLITHRFQIESALPAYELISGSEPSLGVVLKYPEHSSGITTQSRNVLVRAAGAHAASGSAANRVAHADPRGGVAAIIGAGGFAQNTLLPAIRDAGFRMRSIVARKGISAAIAARSFGIEIASSDMSDVLADDEVDTCFILTRHDTHADFVLRALEAGKHVFVEKPLALTDEDLDAVMAAARASNRLLTVGFNRRFARLTRQMMSACQNRSGPLSLLLTVNAGAVPFTHWTQDRAVGGGRIAGEGCHFIDLARAITGAPIAHAWCTSGRDCTGRTVDDVAHIMLDFEDGSTAVIHYLSSGGKVFPKERIEAFVDGRTLVIDNWTRLQKYGTRASIPRRARTQDKGHAAEVTAWLDAIRSGGPAPIPLTELEEVSRWTIRLAREARREPDTNFSPSR